MPRYHRPCPMSLRASLLLMRCCAHVEAARERGDLVEAADWCTSCDDAREAIRAAVAS